MLSVRDAEAMANALRTSLAAQVIEISHEQALESVAAQFGCTDRDALAARIAKEEASSPDPAVAGTGEDTAIGFERTSPVFRIFDEDKAREFYLDFLGFTLDWEHRFADDLPLYAQVSRAGFTLHLSGHHGDGTPGSSVFVEMRGIRAFQQELMARKYRHMRPGLEEAPWGLTTYVIDPFGNRINFCERP